MIGFGGRPEPPHVDTVLVLFNRDLRVHDHTALAEAARCAEHVVPLWVWDDGLLGSDFAAPNRLRFLADSLVDLDRSLRARGAGLVVRRGDVVQEALTVAHETAHRRSLPPRT